MTQLADHIAHARGPSGPNKVRAHTPEFLPRRKERVPVSSPFGFEKGLLNRMPEQEYLYNLAAAVRLLCPASEDAYLAQLERLVRERDPDSSSTTSASSPPPTLLQSKVAEPVATVTTAGSPERLGARM